MSDYQRGHAIGKREALDGLPARANRFWTIDFRNGYSDGFWRGSGAKRL